MGKKEQPFLEKYFSQTNTYVYSLILIIPLIFIYESGLLIVRGYSFESGDILATDILANELIILLFEKIGMRWEYFNIMPALLVMGTIFVLQFASQKQWKVDITNVFLVHIEYVLYAVIFFFSVAWIFPGSISFQPPSSSRHVLVAIGAGVYEEYLFRLVLLSLLMYAFEKGLKVEKQRRIYVSVVLSAVFFAGFHHILGDASFKWEVFFIRTAAGIFFGFLHLTRGYGIAAGTHAGFNLMKILFCV